MVSENNLARRMLEYELVLVGPIGIQISKNSRVHCGSFSIFENKRLQSNILYACSVRFEIRLES